MSELAIVALYGLTGFMVARLLRTDTPLSVLAGATLLWPVLVCLVSVALIVPRQRRVRSSSAGVRPRVESAGESLSETS